MNLHDPHWTLSNPLISGLQDILAVFASIHVVESIMLTVTVVPDEGAFTGGAGLVAILKVNCSDEKAAIKSQNDDQFAIAFVQMKILRGE